MMLNSFLVCRRCVLRSSASNILKSISNFRSASTDRLTHYEVLGLTQNASTSEIRDAFVSLSKLIHPDCNPSDPNNHAKFIRLSEAYSVLSKTQARREYDFSLGRASLHHQTANSPADTRYPYQHYPYADGVGWDDPSLNLHRNRRNAARVPNYIIVAACMGIVALGFVYLFLGYKYSLMKQRTRLDTDRRNLQFLKESRDNARLFGVKRQLEILSEKNRERNPHLQSDTSTRASTHREEDSVASSENK